MAERSDLTSETVRTLARVAGLPLAAGREGVISPTLAAWVAAANELNRKMSEQQHWAIIPITVFSHSRR